MAFQTGTATDMRNMVSQLKTFLEANGWTTDRSGTVTNGFPDTGTELLVHKDDVFLQFAAFINTSERGDYIISRITKGPYDSSKCFVDQPNGPKSYYPSGTYDRWYITTGSMDLSLSGFTYWFMLDNTKPALWIVHTKDAASKFYGFLGLGKIDKIGWTDNAAGHFMTGSATGKFFTYSNVALPISGTYGVPGYSPSHIVKALGVDSDSNYGAPFGIGPYSYCVAAYTSGAILVTSDGTTDWAYSMARGSSGWQGSSSGWKKRFASPIFNYYGGYTYESNVAFPHYYQLMDCRNGCDSSNMWIVGSNLSQFAGVTPLLPIYLYVERSPLHSSKFSLMGTGPNIYWSNMQNLTPGQQYTQGSEQFVSFPVLTKDGNYNRFLASESFANYGLCASAGYNGYTIKITP